MRLALFPFLRATFYRWVELWQDACGELEKAPRILAVGDLHVENFGTWRDQEGRLVWGINDFDEAAYLPYTLDLVRLATSARLAVAAGSFPLTCEDLCTAILAGYEEGLQSGGRPFILAESNTWLRDLAAQRLRDPAAYWRKLNGLPDAGPDVSESAIVALERGLPAPTPPYAVKLRRAGLGSLGRPRLVALAEWKGGRIAREVKALVPSAVARLKTDTEPTEIFYEAITVRAIRCQDPFLRLDGHWIARRLAPDCSRVELTSLPGYRAADELLRAMGWETANVHLGNAKHVAAIQQDLTGRKKDWLRAAADAMTEATETDWKEWKAG
jgi:hypothetical protein